MTRTFHYYILDENHCLVGTDDVRVWGKWFESIKNRRVGEDKIGEITISTVFLGIDHQWGDGPPLVFETMIFGGELNDSQWRYSTWDDAVIGHKMAVKKVKKLVKS